jgi:hypothetical protein
MIRLLALIGLLVCWLLPGSLLLAQVSDSPQSQTEEGATEGQLGPEALVQQIQQLLQKQQELQEKIEELQRQVEELRAKTEAPSEERVQEPTLEELLSPEVPQESETPVSGVTVGAQSFNPDVSVVGDFQVNLGDKAEQLGFTRHDSVNRHIELALSQRISPEAKAVVKWAWGTHSHWHPAHDDEEHVEALGTKVHSVQGAEHEEGEHETHEGLELEEAYVQFDRLINRITLRLGRERLPFMQYNLLDGHELPFVTRPLAISRFFGEHGLVDDGIRVAWLLPTSRYLSLEMGVYNGRNDVAFIGTSSDARTLMGRLHGYTSWRDDTQEVDWNLGWVHGENATNRTTNIYTADATYQRFRTQFDRLIGSVGYVYADINTLEGSRSRAGYYLHLARRWDRYRMNELGALVEGAKSAVPDVNDLWKMYSVYYTWHRTHRARFRLQLSHLDADEGSDEDMVFFQTTYVMGTHPPHD